MEKILGVKQYLQALSGQFTPTKVEEFSEEERKMLVENLDYDKNSVILEVTRNKDHKEFVLNKVIVDNELHINDTNVLHLVAIEYFHEDFIHIDVYSFANNKDGSYDSVSTETIEINELEEYLKDLEPIVTEHYKSWLKETKANS